MLHIQSVRTFALNVAVVAAAGLFSQSAFAAGSHSDGHGSKNGFAFGKTGTAAHVDRTITIDATDNAFDVGEIRVKAGETIRFVIKNSGDFLHEFNIGDTDMHHAHQKEMMEMMESGMMTETGMKDAAMGSHMKGKKAHNDPNSILIKPGETKEMIWTFKKAHGIEFACNVPGHYESGMKGHFKIQ